MSALKRPRSGECAEQCREMGIKVGDTIKGRKRCGRYWHEAQLTLLWMGESEAVFSEVCRSNEQPEWSVPEEAANWTLDCRPWRLVAASKTGA